MKPLYYAAGLIMAVLVVGAAFLFYPAPEKSEPQAKPVLVRFMSNEQLRQELAPIAQRFSGPNVLQVPPGFACYSSETQRYRRVVIVCTA